MKTPFGLSNSPAVFQRYINVIFADLIYRGIVIAYMDDLIIPAVDLETAVMRLEQVLETASVHGLDINW